MVIRFKDDPSLVPSELHPIMERMTKKPKTVFTLEERRKIIQGAIMHGYDFNAICKFVGPSKTKNQMKEYFQ